MQFGLFCITHDYIAFENYPTAPYTQKDKPA
jgi:hypothetical protein